MTRQLHKSFLPLGLLIIVLAACNIIEKGESTTEFVLKYTREVSHVAITGRAVILLSKDTLVDPDIPNPYRPFITIGCDFKDWKPGKELVIDNDNSTGFLTTVEELEGSYSVRVLVDLDTTSCNLMQNGLCYSDNDVVHVGKENYDVVELTVNNVLDVFDFQESEFVRLFEVKSSMLSQFYNSETRIEAEVVLPESYYEDSLRIYPTVFVFPGWGTTHVTASQDDFQQKRYGASGYGEEKIFVIMNQDSRYGYHVFADSENNGPRASSFVMEFIPEFEMNFRAISDPRARFMVGQSSGAWASLWLAVNYPDTFGMLWAGSPDPVSFSDFVGHNLYADDANLFYDEQGNLTSAIRLADLQFTNMDWSEMESALGEGGQYQSFEAVFGHKDTDGKPEQLFDRVTGRIFLKALENWKNYDINRLIISNSQSLKSSLSGKINITVADNDDFFLDGSVKLLKQTLDSLKIDSNVILLSDGGHDAWSDEIRSTMHKRMDSISSGIVIRFNTPCHPD